MKLSIEKLTEMQFNDPFELPEPKKYEEDDCCMFCGNEIPNLKIGFNDKEQSGREGKTNN